MKSVLIIDDDEDIRAVLTEFLLDHGYEVSSASNGAAALRALEQCAPSAILMDLAMPVMDGPSFRRRQLADAHIADIPLLVMSADNRLAVVTEQMKAQACLPKPVHLDFLLEMLQAICESPRGAGRRAQPARQDRARADRGLPRKRSESAATDSRRR